MKNLQFISLLLILLLIACSDRETVENELPSGLKEEYQINKESGKKHGTYKMYYEDGTVFEKSEYKNDSLDGPRQIYFPGGGLEIEEYYDSGVIEGEYKMYYPSGTLKVIGRYNHGEMDSIWTTYYASGSIKEEVTYNSNLEDGPFLEYYESGKIKAKGRYLKGDNEDGILYLYDSTGVEERVMECDSGICRTIWTPDSSFAMPK